MLRKASRKEIQHGRSRHGAKGRHHLNTVHNAFLDWFSPGQSRHPVFGKVIAGQDVVKAIETTPTDRSDRPLTPVQVIKVTVQQG
ncbi:MAG: peptidylprolyl isomerase [Verrucomicrobia bacterium]|nr:peptidylprolyl isomerase [Verrucomicrobiota bacterium]